MRCCVLASAVKPIHVKGPPAAFNHRSATQQATNYIIQTQYRQLLDLAEKGGATVSFSSSSLAPSTVLDVPNALLQVSLLRYQGRLTMLSDDQATRCLCMHRLTAMLLRLCMGDSAGPHSIIMMGCFAIRNRSSFLSWGHPTFQRALQRTLSGSLR